MAIMTKGPQTIRVPGPYRQADYVCGVHPTAAVDYDAIEEMWVCTKCGLDIADTAPLAQSAELPTFNR